MGKNRYYVAQRTLAVEPTEASKMREVSREGDSISGWSSSLPHRSPSPPTRHECQYATMVKHKDTPTHSWDASSPTTDMEHQERQPNPSFSSTQLYPQRIIKFDSIQPLCIPFNALTSQLRCMHFNNSCMVVFMLYLLMSFLQSTVAAFNVDLRTAVVHQGMNSTMFGYAVAQHIDRSGNWLLIGAPKAQTSQRGVERAGAVFRCRVDRVNSCQEIPFDASGNGLTKGENPMPVEEKSNQWFGATIQSSSENGLILACAPRYVYFSFNLLKREPVGMCWVAQTSTNTYEKYSPCAKGKSGRASAKLVSALLFQMYDGRRLMVAAPGSWYWQGQIYNFKTDNGGKVYASAPNSEGPEYDDSTYRGYSSATGRLNGDEEEDYVVGIPKGDYYVGKIEMFSQNLSLIGSIQGEQIGSYFGGALAVIDLNADSLDDIIVGAPFYTKYEHSGSWDTGRVYVFYQSSSNTFTASIRDVIDGATSQSRFGTALTGLGDINYDGYDDLCVGAPYGGEDKTGAIYIFHGSKNGVITDPSQIVYASALKSPLSTFGATLSAGLDQDGNSYPDILVGAYGSEKAVFLRSRPVVRVTATLELPEKISLWERSCSIYDGRKAVCLKIHSCLYYDGLGTPEELYFDLEWVLDAKEGNNSNAEQRAFYVFRPKVFSEKKTVKIRKGQKDDPWCLDTVAFVKDEPGDKLSPIVTALNFRLNLKKGAQKTRRKRELLPILDAYIPTQTLFTVKILHNCGEDEVCIPQLDVWAILISKSYVLGSDDELVVSITVENHGEDAFNTRLFIQLPASVDYSGISEKIFDVPISCDPVEDGRNFVVCNLGNPMTLGSKSQFDLIVKPSNESQDSLYFDLLVNSSNPENRDTKGDNHITFSIPATTDLQIELTGSVTPEILNVTDEKSEGKGRLVRHVYSLKNNGQSALNETELQILWPSHDSQGRPALVLDGPLKIEDGKCEIIIIAPNNASSYPGYYKNYRGLYRIKRPDLSATADKSSQKITCSYYYCTVIQCLFGYKARNTASSLIIHSRLKVRDFIEGQLMNDEDAEDDIKMYHLLTVAHARVRSVPYKSKNIDRSKFPVKRIEVVTKVSTERYLPGEKGLEVWIYAVAITAGFFMLLILILLLWCCGFFKRKKPENEDGYFAVNGKNNIDNKHVD